MDVCRVRKLERERESERWMEGWREKGRCKSRKGDYRDGRMESEKKEIESLKRKRDRMKSERKTGKKFALERDIN
jgi:hypothetical protein